MSNARILVIYYSHEGNTRFVAQTIAEAVGADLLELKPRKELRPQGLMKYAWGGGQVMMKTRPELQPLDRDPAAYDLLFIGTPVWAWNYAPPLRSFIHSARLSGKQVALFCCHGGDPSKTLPNMIKALEGNEVLGALDLRSPLDHREETARRAADWARGIAGE